MRIPFRIVDVFTQRPLAGNQLCVVPDPVELDSDQMHAIAREIGFSETTFVTQAGDHAYSMRIFTPGGELPFAGHPSLGTAFVLVQEERVGNPVVQTVLAGDSVIEVDLVESSARMRQLPPWFGPEAQDLAAVAGAVGLRPEDLAPDLPPQVVSTGLPHLMVALADAETVSRAVPHAGPLAGILDPLGTDGVYVFALTGDGTARARMFAPGVGITEDPATGSAAGPLGAYLFNRGRLEGGRLTISQGGEMNRPSTLHVEVEPAEDGFAVFVGGGLVLVARGEFDLPL